MGSGDSDLELMRRIAAGEPQALAALYDRYAPAVFALGLRMLRDRQESEDFLTDIFWEIWNRADRYDPCRGAPLTYLMTLARSRAIDRQRMATHRPKPVENIVADPPATIDPADGLLRIELSQAVRQAMQQLTDAERQAVEMSFFDGLTHTQIAEKTGKPLGTIKTYIRNGLIRLRDVLRNKNEENKR